MSEIYLPNPKKIVHLQDQPLFPYEDLTTDNKDMLLEILDQDSGIDAFSAQLQHHQRYIYMVAHSALKQLGYKSRYDAPSMYSFSHGFAGFETISDLVHKPQAYNIDLAVGRAAQYLVDTTSRGPEPASDFDAEMQTIFFGDQPAEQDVEADEILMESDYPSTEIPKDILHNLAEAKRKRQKVTERDIPGVDQLFAKQHNIIPEYHPNTYTVLVNMGISRKEDVGQIQARLAGAQFARTLQTVD